MRVLFVCSGNICRSPFAEAVARQIAPGTDHEFASAGTIAIEGGPATSTGIAVAAEMGVDLLPHRAAHLSKRMITESDIVYAMEAEHADAVLAIVQGARVELLNPDGDPIADPYGGDRTEYRVSYQLIMDALENRLGEQDRRQGR